MGVFMGLAVYGQLQWSVTVALLTSDLWQRSNPSSVIDVTTVYSV